MKNKRLPDPVNGGDKSVALRLRHNKAKLIASCKPEDVVKDCLLYRAFRDCCNKSKILSAQVVEESKHLNM